jgi:hypothetical protein
MNLKNGYSWKLDIDWYYPTSDENEDMVNRKKFTAKRFHKKTCQI